MTGGLTPLIVLLPLDERPVNTQLPDDVARIAGRQTVVPPVDALPRFRQPGDTARIGDWLLERAADPQTESIVVSLDLLAYGGLIPSRTSSDSVRDVLARLDTLRTVRAQHPGVVVNAVSLVTRATDSYSPIEEPEYWEFHGRELHALGGIMHEATIADADDRGELVIDDLGIPMEVRADFARRRLRNHMANLFALELLEDGVLSFLAITADDTAQRAAGTNEQWWLRHWQRSLPGAAGLLMYPGADEVGAILVARALAVTAEVAPTFEVVCLEPDGLLRIASYENSPVRDSVERQIRAAGGAVSLAGETDFVLVVHAPDPDHRDWFGRTPARTPVELIARTVEAVRAAHAAGRRVALADVRFGNGGDNELIAALHEAGLLLELAAYGGWNTASNSIGGVVGSCVAEAAGRALCSFDARASRQALLRRLLDDYAYQSIVRAEHMPTIFGNNISPRDAATVELAEAAITADLRAHLARLAPDTTERIIDVQLPWGRSFEVEITFE